MTVNRDLTVHISQVKIFIALFTMQIVLKQLYRDNSEIMQQSWFLKENSVTQFSLSTVIVQFFCKKVI